MIADVFWGSRFLLQIVHVSSNLADKGCRFSKYILIVGRIERGDLHQGYFGSWVDNVIRGNREVLCVVGLSIVC